MKFLSLVLLAGTVFISHPILAQTAPAQPSPSGSPGTSGPTNPGSSTSTGGTAAEAKPTKQVTVSTLTDKDLKDSNDAELGDIERAVEKATDKKKYLVVSRGGFLGFFEAEYLVPVDQIALSGNAVVAMNRLSLRAVPHSLMTPLPTDRSITR